MNGARLVGTRPRIVLFAFAGFLFLRVGNVALTKEIFAKLLVGVFVIATNPLENHACVLELLSSVVQHDLLESFVLRGVGSLTIPVDRLHLLHERPNRAVHIDGVQRQTGFRFVK